MEAWTAAALLYPQSQGLERYPVAIDERTKWKETTETTQQIGSHSLQIIERGGAISIVDLVCRVYAAARTSSSSNRVNLDLLPPTVPLHRLPNSAQSVMICKTVTAALRSMGGAAEQHLRSHDHDLGS